jgi:hypothetical protein
MMGEVSCMGKSTPVLTAELIVDGAVPRNPVISPDGRWVAYAIAPSGITEPPLSALWVVAAERNLTSQGADRRHGARLRPAVGAGLGVAVLRVRPAAAPDTARRRRGRGIDRLAERDL